MTAVRKIRIEEEPVVAANVARANLYVVTDSAPAQAAALEKTGSALKNIALFFAAPFIGLAYIIALPVVGLAVLAVLAGRLAVKYEVVRASARVLRGVGMGVAAPLLGLAYVVLLPFIGLVALAWMGGRAVAAR